MKKTLFVLGCLLIVVPVAWGLSASKFPGTIEDISFKSRMDAMTDGYKPLFDKQVYQELKIVPGEEIYLDRMILTAKEEYKEREKDAKTMPHEEYCIKHPIDIERCPERTPYLDETRGGDGFGGAMPSYSGYTIGGGTVIENNIVTGGSCYPADRETYFTNDILSTGKYEKIDPSFEKGLITIFRKEGGCGQIKNDPCGWTCYGIGSSPDCAGVRVNNRAEAEEVYYTKYYKNYKLDKLPDVIGTDVFVSGIGFGTGTTMGHFREFLGLPRKVTAVDDQMIDAVKNYKGDIHNRWIDLCDTLLQKAAKNTYGSDPKTYKAVAQSYKQVIELQRKNGCHTRPAEPQMRKQ